MLFEVNALQIVAVIILVVFIISIGRLLPKKLGNAFEIVSVIVIIGLLFYQYSFFEAAVMYTAGAIAYGSISSMYSREQRIQHMNIKKKLKTTDSQLILQKKNFIRLITDIGLTIIVSAGAVIFYIFAPETYALLKLIIVMGLVSVGLKTLERIGIFSTTKIYYLEAEQRLIILSIFQSRDYPLEDLKEVTHQSAPDLLRLHPLFTFLSENRDFTLSFNEVLKLSFPGEYVYLTPNDHNEWQESFSQFVDDSETLTETEEVLPLWHYKNLKRLFWKGYFAASVKGVSAYTGLLIILIFLNVPVYLIVLFILLWWMFNLYVSDRVLIASTDAVKVTKGELYERAMKIFKRAGIEQAQLYLVDSPVHNGLATGMNISRGTIMVTKATTELSDEAVEAILAHEAIHIKKRDVLINQLARMLFLGLIVMLVFLFEEQILLLAKNLFLFIPVFYILMILFPLYLSFVSQWTEVRADYLGAKLLDGENAQMSSGLRELAKGVDEAMEKSRTYQKSEEQPMNNVPSDKRPKWLFRTLEFQIMLHPPLYFRIENIEAGGNWRKARNNWMKKRLFESIPFI